MRLPNDTERRRRRNAKRFLWACLALSVLVLLMIIYTSVTAPDPQSRSLQGTVPAQDERPRQTP